MNRDDERLLFLNNICQSVNSFYYFRFSQEAVPELDNLLQASKKKKSYYSKAVFGWIIVSEASQSCCYRHKHCDTIT